MKKGNLLAVILFASLIIFSYGCGKKSTGSEPSQPGGGTNHQPAWVTPPSNITVNASSVYNQVDGTVNDVDTGQILTCSSSGTTCGFSVTVSGFGGNPQACTISFTAPGSSQVCSLRVKAADNGSPSLSIGETITITVQGGAANNAPTWSQVPSNITVTINAGYSQTNGTATDADTTQALACSNNSMTCGFAVTVSGSGGNPQNCAISFTAPSSSQTCYLRVEAADNGSPSLSVGQTITITVQPQSANNAPQWSAPPSNITVGVGTGYNQTDGTATDVDTGQTLTCTSNGTTCGFTVTVSGYGASPRDCAVSFTTPGSPQTCGLRIQVADNGSPSLSVGQTIMITVQPAAANHAPTWSTAPSNIAITGGSVYNHTNGTATDVDTGQTLTCSNNITSCGFTVTVSGFGGNPQDCNISFTAPSSAQTCSLRVQVADNGSPSLTVGQTISISVGGNSPPTWQTLPTNIAITTGSIYSATNGVLTDPDVGQTLSCSENGSDCAFNITVSGSGPKPVNCVVNFVAGAPTICHLRITGSDNTASALTVGQTVTISVSGGVGNWIEVGAGSASGGGISNNSGYSGLASLAVNSSGNPVVAWMDFTPGDAEIYIKRWTGSAWAEVGTGSASGGGISNNSGSSSSPSLVLNSSGNPVVAWSDNSSGNFEIYLKQWNGSAWAEVGTGSASGGGISSNGGYSGLPSLALDSSGKPVVAWDDNSSGRGYREIYIRRWNGAAWVELSPYSASGGGISQSGAGATFPSLALDSSGNPVVAWSDYSSGINQIYVKRWDSVGAAWEEIGAGSASGDGISGSGAGAMFPSLAFDYADNPVVAWVDSSSSSNEIYIRRWNPVGGTWDEIGAGSASSGGISNNSGDSGRPSLALDSYGNPVVAWYDNSSGNYEIYIKRWTGNGWVEIGYGSTSGGGISVDSGISEWPYLALDAYSNPLVAWDDDTSGDNEIYVKRWQPNAIVTPNNAPTWQTAPTNIALSGGSVYNQTNGTATDVDTGQQLACWSNGTSCGFAVTVSGTGAAPRPCTIGFTAPLQGQTCNLRLMVADNGTPVMTIGQTISITVKNHAPIWQTVPTNIVVSGGDNYSQTNGTATDIDSSQTLTCSTTVSSCPFGISVGGFGGNPQACAVSFLAPWPAQTCNLRMMVADNGTPTATVGRTISITIQNNAPIWQAVPTDITMLGGQVYNQTNGIAIDTKDSWQALTCSYTSTNCAYPITVTGSGGNPQSCNVSFAAPTSMGTCNLRIQVADNGSPSLTVGQTISITVPNSSPYFLAGQSPSNITTTSGSVYNSTNGVLSDPDTGQLVTCSSNGTTCTGFTPVVTGGPGSAPRNCSISFTAGPAQTCYLRVMGSDNAATPATVGQTISITIPDRSPRWQTGPGNIMIMAGSVYNATNGILTDPDNGDILSCASNTTDCGFGINVTGAGLKPLNCRISFTAGTPRICHLRVMGSDNVLTPLTVGQTVTISISEGVKNFVEIGTGSATAGGISSDSGYSAMPSVALDIVGNPVVAWMDSTSGKSQIYIKRWNGTAWVGYLSGTGDYSGGGISSSTGATGAMQPSLAITPSGNPIVTWADDSSGNYEIYVKRWTGSAWAAMGAGSASGGGISNNSGYSALPSLAVDSLGNPYVAWEDDSSGILEIFLKGWDGGSWVEINEQIGPQEVPHSALWGGISNSGAGASHPSLAIDSFDNPAVAWMDLSSGMWEIYLKQWDGTWWLGYTEGDSDYTGTGVSRSSAGTWGARHPSLAFDYFVYPAAPVLAWQDDASKNQEIYIVTTGWFQGITNVGHGNPLWGAWWEILDEKGNSSMRVGGVSMSSGDSDYPSLVIDPYGMPVVAWTDNSSGNYEIYIKPWPAGSWAETGIGTSTGGGISYNGGNSQWPSLAIDTTGVPYVTWMDDTSGNDEIYIKRLQPTAVTNHGPTWSAAPGNISINGGSIYNQINGSATDVDKGQILTCSSNGMTCGFAVTVSGSGASPRDCNLSFTAPIPTQTCKLRMMVADNGATALSIGQTISITVNDNAPIFSIFPTDISITSGSLYTATNGTLQDVDTGQTLTCSSNGTSCSGFTPTVSGTGVSPRNCTVSFTAGKPQACALRVMGSDNYSTAATVGQTIAITIPDRAPSWQTGPSNINITSGSVYTATNGVLTDPDNGDTLTCSSNGSDCGFNIAVTGAGIKPLNCSVSFTAATPRICHLRIMGADNYQPAKTVGQTINISISQGIKSFIEIGAGSASGVGISANNGYSALPSLALDSSGRPVMAWMDNTSGKSQIYVKHWNGSAWAGYSAGNVDYTSGGISSSAGANGAMQPSLKIDPSGYPVVAWADDASGNYEIYIKRWNGSAWVTIGAGSASGGGISNNAGFSALPSLALTSSGNPVVAWQDDSSGVLEIYVKRWNGAAWVGYFGAADYSGGGISMSSPGATNPSLAIDPTSTGNPPIVAWMDYSVGSWQIYVMHWDGAAWIGYVSGMDYSGTGMSCSSGKLGARYPSLVIDPAYMTIDLNGNVVGTPMLAWQDDSSGNDEIYLAIPRSFQDPPSQTSSGWFHIYDHSNKLSAAGGGISQNSGDSEHPTLGINPYGLPVVAWEDNSSGNFEIYVKPWPSGVWVETGIGTSTGGGISYNSGNSEWPSMVLDSNGLPYVAWMDDTSGNSEIYIRRMGP